MYIILFFTIFTAIAIYSEYIKTVKTKPPVILKPSSYSDSNPLAYDTYIAAVDAAYVRINHDKKAYLQSHYWQLVRRNTYKHYDGICQSCGDEGTEVHHISYANLHQEIYDEDITLLCRTCHQNIHSKLGYNKYHFFPIK